MLLLTTWNEYSPVTGVDADVLLARDDTGLGANFVNVAYSVTVFKISTVTTVSLLGNLALELVTTDAELGTGRGFVDGVAERVT